MSRGQRRAVASLRSRPGAWGDEWTRAADFVRKQAEANGAGAPITRRIRGQLWIAFDEVLLDEIADYDDLYDQNEVNRPFFCLASGAIKATPGHEDEAIVRLALQLYPFNSLLPAKRLVPNELLLEAA